MLHEHPAPLYSKLTMGLNRYWIYYVCHFDRQRAVKSNPVKRVHSIDFSKY